MNTSSHEPSRPWRISGSVISREIRPRDAPTVRAASSSSVDTCISDDEMSRIPYASQTTVYASQTLKIVWRSGVSGGKNRNTQRNARPISRPGTARGSSTR